MIIYALDQCLANLIEKNLSGQDKPDVNFDLPDSEWRSRLSARTINCYLYDVRQNFQLMPKEILKIKDAGSGSIVRYEPLARIDCAYCITAWSLDDTDRARDEHRMLDQVASILLRHRRLPDDVLPGELGGLRPYPIAIASEDGLKSQPDFWRALDQQLKPSLNYVLSAPVFERLPPPDKTITSDDTEVFIEPDPEKWRVHKETFQMMETPQ